MTTTTAIPSVSPHDVNLEGRLELSLDALIKERKKEHKQLKKQEETKKSKKSKQSLDKRKSTKQQKPQQNQKQKFNVRNSEKTQRKALVHKNRGLPTLPVGFKDRTVEGKTKTSIAAITAKLRRQIQEDRAKNVTSRLVFSPRLVKGVDTRQQSQKGDISRQTRKIALPTRVVQPKGGKKQQSQEKGSGRQVMRSNSKTAKLNITMTAPAVKKRAQKKQKTAVVLVPGKLSQTLAKKTNSAKKVVKRATNRKIKSTQVVRKVADQRKRR